MATKSNTDWTTVTLSGNQDIDAILSQSKWASTNLTYSFPDTFEEYSNFGDTKAQFSKFSVPAQTAARKALDVFESVSNLKFTKVDETADTKDENNNTVLGTHANIRFANTSNPSNPTATGTFPNWPGGIGGDMHFNTTRNPGYANPVLGSYDYYTTMHEIGHALGLAHGHLPDAFNYNGQLPAGHNSIEYSIMTYRSYEAAPQNNTIYAQHFSQSLMMNDIAALQYLYGANFNFNNGDNIYSFSNTDGSFNIDGVSAGGKTAGNKIFRTIWDGGGNDTYDFSNFSTDQTIDLQPGKFSILNKAQLADLDTQSNNNMAAGNVYNALQFEGKLDSLIENAVGGKGNDTITGNELSNILDGGDKNDTLFGREGNDKLFGGKGINELNGGDGANDYGLFNFSRYTYTKSGATDVVYTGSGLSAGEITTVKSDVEHVLFNVERIGGDLVYNTSRGVTKAFIPVGSSAQTLHLNDDGSSSAIDISSIFDGGSLNFFGTSYSSLYVNNNGNITFNNGLSTYTPGSIPGNGSAIIAPFWGDVDTRLKSGQSGFANGKVQWSLDPIHGSFTATWSSVNYYNATSSSNTPKFNSFQLQLIDQGSGDFEIIFRYSAVNWTTGTASGGNNQGLGGTIARAGFTSGDGDYGEYYELTSSGNQQAMLDLDSALGNTGIAGVWQWRVSNGAIKGIGGDKSDTLDGDGLPNYIDGRGGDDFLNGLGGADTLIGGTGKDQLVGAAGADRLFGGADDDNYIITDALDTIYEYAGEGTKDTVQAGIDFTLKAYSQVNIENLVLIGSAVKGTGNETSNEITGNDKNNTLSGMAGNDTLDGGTGDDTLLGGAGADQFVGGQGKDKMDGGADFDTVTYSTAVTINLTTGAHTGDALGDTYLNIELIEGSDSGDTLTGGAARDGFFGRGGEDFIYGMGGDDGIEGGAGADYLDGGANTAIGDQVTYQHSSRGVIFSLNEDGTANVADNSLSGSGTGDANGDTVLNFENITGTNLDDIIGGNSKANIIEGLNGNDVLVGNGGKDKLDGGAGTDTVTFLFEDVGILLALDKNGNAGVLKNPLTSGVFKSTGTTLISIENVDATDQADIVQGGAGNNTIRTFDGDDLISASLGNDDLDGGADNDSLSLSLLTPGKFDSSFIHLGTGGAKTTDSTIYIGALYNLTLSKIENVTGWSGIDALIGNDLVNKLDGGSGNDVIEGGGGADILIGGAGVDTLSYLKAGAQVMVNLALKNGLQLTLFDFGSGLVANGDAGGDTATAFENIIGSDYDDNLTGNDLANVITGGKGADTMSGRLGIDTLSYADSANGVSVLLNGNNAAVGTGGDAQGDQAFGFENIIGSHTDDTLGGDISVNVLDGGGGWDTADYSLSNAAVKVNLGVTDKVTGASTGSGGWAQGDKLISIENIVGSNLGDELTGRYVNSSIIGLDNRSTKLINGGGGNDIIHVGNNTAGINGGYNTLLDGGTQIDTVVFDGVTFNAILTLGSGGGQTTGSGSASNFQFQNIENITGSKYNDVFTGNDLKNVILGGSGDDLIIASGGGDTLDGGAGVDTVSFENSGADTRINIDPTLKAANTSNDGGDATGITLLNFENVIGSVHEDTIFGNALANIINSGDDDDHIEGGGGNDTIEGGAGGDYMSGGTGTNTLSYASSSLAVTVTLNGSSQATTSGGDAESDQAYGFQNVTGSVQNDTINGDANVNVLVGGNGRDVLKAGGGADTINGGQGGDELWGEGNATGVAGADKFVFKVASDSAALFGQFDATTSDKIMDFKSGVDKIELTGIDTNGSTSADDKFHFVAAGHADGTMGALWFQASQVDPNDAGKQITYVYADLDGNNTADMAWEVHTIGTTVASQLHGTDFLL